MITKMTGTLTRVLDDEARLQVGPFEYQVLIPEFVRRQVQTRTGAEVTFHTLEYIEGGANASKMIPRRVGFLSESELDFFELFCTVDKIGSKKALKAMGRPIKEMADAIQRQDAKWLTALPGIGAATADAMLAGLRKKVGKFAQLPDGDGAIPRAAGGAAAGQVIEDAYAALVGLGLNPIDARGRLDAALANGQTYPSVEALLAGIFSKKT